MKKIIKESLRHRLNESISDQLKAEVSKFGAGDFDISFGDKHITAHSDGNNVELGSVGEISTLQKIALVCTMVGGLVSCQKPDVKYIYKYSYKTPSMTTVATDLTPENHKLNQDEINSLKASYDKRTGLDSISSSLELYKIDTEGEFN